MNLLFLAVAYLLGIAIGQLLWRQGLFGCGLPGPAWLLPLALLPATLWQNRRAARLRAQGSALAWPTAAGFRLPRPTLTPWLIAGLLLAGLAGTLRLAAHPPAPCWGPADLAFYNSPDLPGLDAPSTTLDGFVASYPVRKNGRWRLDVQVTALHRNGQPQPISGRVRLQTGSRHPFRYGEPVRISGLLAEPPVFDSFDYRVYLARKGIHSLMQRPRIQPWPGPLQGSPLLRPLYRLRARGQAVLNRLLPEPYAALANGMLLGVEAGIPDELYEQFNLTGTSHVIVISGSNVAVVAGVLLALGIKLFGRRFALWPTLTGIGLYALLVGGDAAVLRAALMGGLFVWATVLGRQSTALVSLAAACWAMTLANPLTLWDVGFQLSSAATAGLVLFGPGLTAAAQSLRDALTRRLAPPDSSSPAQFLLPNSLWDLLRDGLLMTIAASATTLPLIVYYFGRLSLVSLLTNLLIAPVQPFVMIWGGLGVLVGLLGLLPLAQALLWIPYGSLWWTVAMVRWTAALPGGSLEVAGYGGGLLALTYAGIFAWRWHTHLARWSARLRKMAAGWHWQKTSAWATTGTFAGCAGLALLLWRLALSQPDGQLHVYFLDIGQGDGIFIQTPSGRQVLIDGGSDGRGLMAELGAVMPFWDRRIDLAVLTHPDWDHMGGQVDLPQRYGLEQAFISENTRSHEDAQPWQDALAAAAVPVAGLQQGAWLDLGDGVALWVLWPPPESELSGLDPDDKNERSLVLKLVYGEFSVLLTGDAGLPAERWLQAGDQPLAAQVLKVGHHGSGDSTGPGFVRAVGAPVAVIQVGENRYGHPTPAVLDGLGGRVILRNDRHGRVHMRSDGQLLWIETETGKDWMRSLAGE